VLQDSTYFEPETMEPFTGEVFRLFDKDPEAVQLTGFLQRGLWNGEMTVYYPNGRMRYQGELVDGERCGAWLENRDENPPADLLTEVMEEIESLAMYPQCPDS
jgi:antitoxin component YwqK of YwqJK toxin-antitoxin module